MLLTIETLLNNGHGLARSSSGEVIFVPDCLPGDQVRLESANLTKRKGVLWAQQVAIEKESALRSSPNCTHYWDCGGCATLHIKPSEELNQKVLMVKDVIARVGKWQNPDVQATDFPASGSRHRGKLHANGNALGWRQKKSHQIIPIKNCHVLPFAFQELLPNLSTLVRKTRFRGELYFAIGPSQQEIVLSFHGTWKTQAPFLDWNVPETIKGWRLFKGKSRRPEHTFGVPHLQFSWSPFQVNISPESFFQSNPKSWLSYFQILDTFLEQFQPQIVWDVHAGSGFLTSRLHGRQVFASEPVPNAFHQLKQNLTRLNWSFQIFKGPAEAAIKEAKWLTTAMDALILDPPRTGLEQGLKQWLKEKKPPALLYFSCDLATFARDLSHLREFYQPEGKLHLMNINPGTLRCELATVLVRKPFA